jgi:hypothetical protein
MKRLATSKLFLYGTLLLFALSVVLSILSFLPVAGADKQTSIIIDDSFRLTPQETYRQGLGTFNGDENLSIAISGTGNNPINFTLLTYGGLRYSNVITKDINYSFSAGADYYEAVFLTNSTTDNEVHFQVSVQKQSVVHPFSWLATPAKALFLFSWSSAMLLLLLSKSGNREFSASPAKKLGTPLLSQKSHRRLQIVLLLSLVFWLLLLVANTYPLATFENWYTDSARHPYSANLFTKVGFSIFDTPLGKLSSSDGSFYKFVTWPEMPHLYPLGSVFLFLPFGWLLENGVTQVLVFKMEIALFLVVSHIGLYYFLKRFWKQDMSYVLKALGIYLLYIVLVVYSADGQFDAVAFLFSMIALVMFLEERYDFFLLFVAVAVTFKYQAGIFLFPLIMVSLLRIFQQHKPSVILKNKAVLAAIALAAVDLFTAYLSAPFLMSARPEFVMNGVNAFSPHAQISWSLQSFAVLLTLAVTLISAVYLLNKSRLISLFAVFSLLPCFTMPYFQPWYLPFFFVYPLIPQQKHTLEVTMVWLIFMVIVLSFGGSSYNPVQILDNVRKLLNL